MDILLNDQYYKGLAEVLDALPERVVRYRLPDLTIVYCNTSWAAWYDLEPAQAVGHRLDEFLSDDGRAGLASQLAVLGADNPLVVDPVARVAPNRPGRWVEWVDRYLPSDDGDEVLAVGRDITARHIAETRLVESEARFRDLADKSTDILWHFVVDPHPHLDYISPSVEAILGYAPSYLTDDFDRFLAILAEADRAMIQRGRRRPAGGRSRCHGSSPAASKPRRARPSRPTDRPGQPAAVQGAVRGRPGPYPAWRSTTRRCLPRSRRLQERQRLIWPRCRRQGAV